jgi:hypothetical protein
MIPQKCANTSFNPGSMIRRFLNTSIFTYSALLLFCYSFPGCSRTGEPVAGKTIETTNGFSATVMLSGGAPARNAEVLLIDAKNWLRNISSGTSSVLDSVTTDDRGQFIITDKPDYPCNLIIETESEGSMISDVSKDLLLSGYRDTIVLDSLVTYEGVVRLPSTGTRLVWLAGTVYRNRADASDGGFILAKVPRHEHTVLLERETEDGPSLFFAGKTDLSRGPLAHPDTLVSDTGTILTLEDFEDKDNRCRLGPLLGGGWWDVYSDEYTGGSSILLQPENAAPDRFAQAIRDGGPGRERALQVLYTPGGAGIEKAYPYVFAGLNLGSEHYNLSGLDTLSFLARGNGQIVVELVQTSGSAFKAVAATSFTLTADWQEFYITPADLAVETVWFEESSEILHGELLGQGLPLYVKRPESWEELEGMVSAVHFNGTAGNEFWLDDIRIRHVTLGDLIN